MIGLDKTQVSGKATAVVLTGDPLDVNSVAESEKVAPKTALLQGVAPTFVHKFPACSVSVLRLQAR